MNIGALLRRWTHPDTAAPPTDQGPTGHDADAASRSHVGRVRLVNEDRFLVRSDRGLWAIADGMGGHTAGAAAATVAIAALDRLADDAAPIDDAAVIAALHRANRDIRAEARGDTAIRGATIVVARLDAADVTIFWAGDSRAYHIRDGHADCLTRDHSVVQELIDAGILAPAAAGRHPHANVITRALGVADAVAIEVVRARFAAGDRLMLCSDGISRSLDPRDFAAPNSSLNSFTNRILRNALQRDGTDNATLVAIDRVTRSTA